MSKQKAKDYNVGAEAIRIQEEQNISLRQAFGIATRLQTAMKNHEEKTAK